MTYADNGYSWKHRSMEWREACGLMKMMHQTITQSVYLPSDALGFWAIPYLMSQGISVEQAKQFLEFAKDLLLKGLPVPAELHECPIVPEAMHVESLPVKETVLQ